MGFLKALESRVIETKAAHGGRGPDGQVCVSVLQSQRQLKNAVLTHTSARSPELTGQRERPTL